MRLFIPAGGIRVKLVDRTLDALEALAREPEGVGVVRLAQVLGEPPSSVHRLLTSLARRQYVVRDPSTRHYRLGVAVLRLAQGHQEKNLLLAVAKRHLAVLSAATLESVFLCELLDDDVVCVASAESPRPLSFYMRPGQRMPYHAASSARAILAFKSADEQLRLLRSETLEVFTPLTPTTVRAALAELARTRDRGYAVCDREMEAGIVGLAVPIRGPDGAVNASVTLVAPENRLTGSLGEEALRELNDTARAVETELGYVAEPLRRDVLAG
jgi:IclR family acetate operon transcriptional repressor